MGEFYNSLDEKGRISIPSKVRNQIDGDSLVLTKGIEKCLWGYTSKDWRKISAQIREASSVFNAKTRRRNRRLIAPAQDCEIDKSGRVNIPQSLREYAGLNKEVVLLEMVDYYEIWDVEEYKKILEESEDDVIADTEDLGNSETEKDF